VTFNAGSGLIEESAVFRWGWGWGWFVGVGVDQKGCICRLLSGVCAAAAVACGSVSALWHQLELATFYSPLILMPMQQNHHATTRQAPEDEARYFTSGGGAATAAAAAYGEAGADNDKHSSDR